MGEVVLISRSSNGCGGGGGVGERKADHQERQGQGQVLELLLAALRKSVVLPCQMADADDPAGGAAAGGWGMDIGWPTDVRHVAHVTFDRLQGFLGLPVEFELLIPCPAPSASASVFGVSPESMQCGYDDRGNSVPKILLLMQERLYSQDGLKAEGIFRITPENSQEEHVREQLNRGVVPDDIDVHCLASLIKAWFRELPVLDSLSPEQVLNCNTEEQCVELVSHIPVTHAALLSWVVELMADVVEEEESNKMNARNIAMVFAPNMTQMSDPLTALMHAVQVMNLLKTLVLKTLREREDDEGSYSTFSSSPTLSDGLDEVDREHDQGDDNDSGAEKYGDGSSESPKDVDKATNLTMDSEQLIGSSRRHTSFEFRLPCTIDNDDDKYPSLSDIEEGFLRRLEWQEVSKGGDEDEGSIFFTTTKEAEQLSSSESISESCRVSDQTSSTEDAVGTNSIELTMQMETRTEATSEEATNAKEVTRSYAHCKDADLSLVVDL